MQMRKWDYYLPVAVLLQAYHTQDLNKVAEILQTTLKHYV